MNLMEVNLARPPIIEVVLDIDCDPPPGLDLRGLEARAREVLCERYPEVRPVYWDEHRIEASADGTSKVSTARRGLQALQFLQQDGQQIVQVRNQGYSFNRLVPYEGLDRYLSEIERTWGLYCGLVSPVVVRVIRLRTINRILLPFADGHVPWGDYLKLAPNLAVLHPMNVGGFATHATGMEPGTGNEMNLMLTTQPVEGGRLPVILDIGVAASVEMDPPGWDGIECRIKSLRVLKNRLFVDSLTEKCLNLFQ